jgi:3-phenylpropionate/trans-cinnamate dioxygenase ferredoxin reductase subunit
VADRSVDVLIVGAGVAGASCASELRSEGFEGSVLLVGRELDPPYERPPITKSLLREGGDPLLVPYGDDVGLLTRTSVMKIDPSARSAELSDKSSVAFDRAVLCTGANVRRLPIEGTDLEGIHYLRALRNAAALRADVDGVDRVAIVGGSFIGCEVAASLSMIGIASTMVFPEPEPMALQFGVGVGGWVRSLLEEHGVEVIAGEQVAALEGEGEDVEKLLCASGRSVDCQAVVIGVGAVPDVMLARSSGFELGSSGGVLCSSSLETSVEGVFCAGDACEYDSVIHGRHVRIEHFEVAAGQGKCAARNVMGAGEAYSEVPYFWSDIGDWATIESVGPAVDGWDDEEVRGSFESGEFSVMYSKGGRLVAAITRGRGADLDEAREKLSAGAAG